MNKIKNKLNKLKIRRLNPYLGAVERVGLEKEFVIPIKSERPIQ
jgi:hypothetical protein